MRYKPNLESLVLGALKEKPLHGYAIAKLISKESEEILKLGENQLYPTLHKLEREGLVQAEWQPQEGKPPRKQYLLTEAGHAQLQTHREGWLRYSSGMNTILGINSLEATRG
jgi:PadR family transcriptional regulator, regulatory protein PadR